MLACIEAGELERAAEHLVHAYADEVMGMCTAMVRNRTVAEDLTQDVFGRAFASLGGFRGEASPRTWLLRIARNRCIDHLRAAKRDPWGGVAVDSEEADNQPDDAPLPPDLILRRDDVDDALAQLAEGDRALVVLRFRNGLDYSELAMAFGIKEGTVRMRVSRALTKMRRALETKHAEPASAPMQQASPGPAAPLEPSDELAGAPAEEMLAQGLDEAETSDARAEVVEPAPRAKRASFVSRIADAFRSEPPAAPTGPPPQHPLTAFFAATRSPLTEELRTALLSRAHIAGD